MEWNVDRKRHPLGSNAPGQIAYRCKGCGALFDVGVERAASKVFVPLCWECVSGGDHARTA